MQHSDLSDDARSGVLSRFSRSLEAALHPAVQENEEDQEAIDARGGSNIGQVRRVSIFQDSYSGLQDGQDPCRPAKSCFIEMFCSTGGNVVRRW